MADLHRDPSTDTGSPPPVPRWVKVAAAVAGILVLLFVALQLAGVGGEHGPGRHGLGDGTPSAAVVDGLASFVVVRG